MQRAGRFQGLFQSLQLTGAKIVEFTLRVSSPYDRGLLLLSETSEGSMLSFKRLDVMETPVSPSAFKDNNPTLSLGKTPLALCWKGEGITSPNAASLTDEDYEVVIGTGRSDHGLYARFEHAGSQEYDRLRRSGRIPSQPHSLSAGCAGGLVAGSALLRRRRARFTS